MNSGASGDPVSLNSGEGREGGAFFKLWIKAIKTVVLSSFRPGSDWIGPQGLSQCALGTLIGVERPAPGPAGRRGGSWRSPHPATPPALRWTFHSESLLTFRFSLLPGMYTMTPYQMNFVKLR